MKLAKDVTMAASVPAKKPDHRQNHAHHAGSGEASKGRENPVVSISSLHPNTHRLNMKSRIW